MKKSLLVPCVAAFALVPAAQAAVAPNPLDGIRYQPNPLEDTGYARIAPNPLDGIRYKPNPLDGIRYKSSRRAH